MKTAIYDDEEKGSKIPFLWPSEIECEEKQSETLFTASFYQC